MRAVRMMTATAAASVLTVFAVLGIVHLVETILPRLVPSPIAVSELRLDFGSIPVNGSESRELVVRNDGTGPVHARFLVNGASYRVEPEELILHPGVEWAITVVASPARPGRIDDVLRIQVVGGSSAPVMIPLAAVADEVIRGPEWEMNRV